MKNTFAIASYLTFNGNCREAMTFYHQCLGGEIQIMAFKDMPGEIPPGAENLVMHANIHNGDLVIMASDTMPGQPVSIGNNFSLSVNCLSKEQANDLFAKLGANGAVVMPLQDTFWGAYFGMLTDKFGVNWMFNYDSPKS